MLPIKQKVFAYITHQQRLLLFAHTFIPEAGIQVPAGTLEPGEQPESGVLREAFEETGLSGLLLDRLLGIHERDMSDFGNNEIHRRYFYHLIYPKPVQARWRHAEEHPSSHDEQGPILFDFFWATIPHEVPPLIADHGWFLPQLHQRLNSQACAAKNI
ncbi:DNA mismatch repair protein MutT [Dictyobacter sp. S3.2.2.5]|uniref:DNA mismatch repair protein MutT n=1 Tax=Dictyobacter halimunensis TaxID=3026934 RepID=A0ABQ6G784_9CHLR|nr:DNA mismatch repair protein MutT [Dictyobacter sp. S3.2.2.5]